MKKIGCLLVLVLAVTACGRGEAVGARGSERQAAQGSWTELPEAPLSARRSAHAVEVDGKLLIVGGTPAAACPPAADCITPTEAPFSDGAAYDPTTHKWTQLASSPVPIGYASSAVLDGRVYVLVAPFGSTHPRARRAFLSYEMASDEWEELDLPPSSLYRTLTATDSTVVAYQSSQENGVEGDFAYDPVAERWSELPADPLRVSFDRSMVWTDHGLVLLGIENVPNPGAEEPALYRAALLSKTGEWRRLPDSEVMGYNPLWSWTQNRVLNAAIESGDGGETNNWGRTYFAGGILDPSTGEWSYLPNLPQSPGPFTGIYASNDTFAVAGGGWVFDAENGTWLELTRPPGAPESEHAHAWLGDQLVVWGGVRYEGNEGALLARGWSWVRENP